MDELVNNENLVYLCTTGVLAFPQMDMFGELFCAHCGTQLRSDNGIYSDQGHTLYTLYVDKKVAR